MPKKTLSQVFADKKAAKAKMDSTVSSAGLVGLYNKGKQAPVKRGNVSM